MFRGALVVERFPVRACNSPSWSYTVGPGPTADMIGSNSETSSSWPWPEPPGRSRCHSAVMTAATTVMPAIESARPMDGSVGGPSGSPVTAANPLMASARVPKPGRSR